jgi:predicted TIM-barrel fold metal-dependent hydrolase
MIRLFDCNAVLGPLTAAVTRDLPTASELLAEMDRVGIARSLVYHSLAREWHAPTGNEKLLNAVADSERLEPCWVLLPPATGEMLPPEELLRQMQASGVHAARLFPGPDTHNFSLAAWCSGTLLAVLEEARVPTFMDLDQTDWETLADLLDRHPHLPIVLTNVSYRIDRYLYPLWERHGNLFVELSSYQGQNAIEAVCERFGAERLLFGTNLPEFEAGPTIAHLAYAEISEPTRSAIAGGNLEGLLAGAYA